LRDKLFQLLDELRQSAPLGNVLPFEINVALVFFVNDAIFHQDLRGTELREALVLIYF